MADSSGESLFKLYRYDPSAAAAAIFVALFFIITILHTYQMVCTKTWYFLPFVIGGFFEWIGYIGRIISANQTPNWTVGPYVQQTLLLLVAPALFAASIYMGLGRIIFLTDGEAHSPIPGKWLTKIFVCGDVVSFVLQGAGGGIMASGTLEALEKGEHIVIGGLVVQIVFFSVFVAVGTIFHYKMRMVPTPTAAQEGLPWQAHMHTLYAASILILVRSLFRLVEYAQGNDGYIVSHEVFLYIFDALLMFAAMAVFAWKHPSEVNALLRGGGNKAVKNVVVVYPIY